MLAKFKTSRLAVACQTRTAKIGAATAALFATVVINANAAASPTTGVDYVADLVTPIKSELTLAIVAGLGLMVVIVAIKVGTRLVRSFAR